METIKKEEGKQVNMNGNQPAQTQPAVPEVVFKFSPEAYTALEVYLKGRPMREVKGLYTAFFRHGHVDPYYTQESITRLVEYLSQCPFGEVEGILTMLEKNGLIQYMPEVKKKEDQTEKPATAAE